MRGRLVVLAVAMVSLTPFPLCAQTTADAGRTELRQRLDGRLQDIASRLDGVMAYAIVDLTSGDRIDRLPDTVSATASTIKLAVLYELFRQADEGRLRLDDVRPLDRRQAVGGTGILAQLSAPSLPLRDYATLMIALSDNTATNVLIDAVGMSNVTARMASLGLQATRLRRKMMDGAAARRGDENVSTAREIARLLEIVYRGDGLLPASRQELLEILQKPKSTPIHRGIGAGVAVASKSGTLEGIEVDAGIVLLPDRPYIFCAMTSYLTRGADGETAIGEASRAAFDYFTRLARSSEYGRVIR